MERLLDLSADQIRELDWSVVDHARDHHRRFDSALPRFVAVPIDVAQEWWDDNWGFALYLDGTEKPMDEAYTPETRLRERAKENRRREQDQQVHKIQNEGDLRAHLVRDHGHEYLKAGGPSYSLNHRNAHVDEAEDYEWDRRLRGVNLPPPPG